MAKQKLSWLLTRTAAPEIYGGLKHYFLLKMGTGNGGYLGLKCVQSREWTKNGSEASKYTVG